MSRWLKKQPPPEPEKSEAPDHIVYETRRVSPIELMRLVGMQATIVPAPARPEGPKTLAQVQAEQRDREARAANGSDQPFEWATHVALTVDGQLRWRCCGNLFTEDHSPYCFMPPGVQL